MKKLLLSAMVLGLLGNERPVDWLVIGAIFI
jgi:hypothetical protein